jgi:hypothetical protein
MPVQYFATYVPLRALELASVLSLLHPQAFLKPISSDPRVMGVCFGKAEENALTV